MPLSRKLVTLTSWNPVGHSRPVMGLVYLFYNLLETTDQMIIYEYLLSYFWVCCYRTGDSVYLEIVESATIWFLYIWTLPGQCRAELDIAFRYTACIVDLKLASYITVFYAGFSLSVFHLMVAFELRNVQIFWKMHLCQTVIPDDKIPGCKVLSRGNTLKGQACVHDSVSS